MNSESAGATEKKSFRLETISFDKIPNQTNLFLDFQANSSDIQRFYPEKLSKEFVEKVLANYKTDRNELCNSLEKINSFFCAPKKVLENIKLLRENDCVAIVTGQQAGIFSGALYTIYKAISAVQLAESLRARNIKAVPVFWIAEEDHDFAEVKKTFVINRESKLAEIENTPPSFAENSPVGFIKFDKTIEHTINEIFDSLQQTEFSNKLKTVLSATYRQGETYSTAFAKFLTKFFGKYGLIIFSPLDEKLKKLSAPVFADAVKNSDKIRSVLLERTRELGKANYHAQVLVEKDFFPFFLIEKNKRLALKKNSGGNYQAKGTKLEFTRDELIKIAENEPQKLSPNALMRPIVQDFLLPTATYFGGAAEIAYFAQNAEIYRLLKRPVTPILHRASITVVEAKNRRALDKYKLKLKDLFTGKEEISARVVNEFLACKTAEEFTEAKEIFNAQLNRLDKTLARFEPTLSVNLANRRRKILYHVDALQKRFQHSEIQKNETVNRRIDFLFTSLFPHKALQERALNVLYFLNIYGGNFVDWLYDTVDSEGKEHQIFYL